MEGTCRKPLHLGFHDLLTWKNKGLTEAYNCRLLWSVSDLRMSITAFALRSFGDHREYLGGLKFIRIIHDRCEAFISDNHVQYLVEN
jgi:hypothetical protein